MYKFEKIYIGKTTHDWQNSFKSWRCKIIFFSLLLLGTCIGNNVFLGVCAVVCLRAFFWELTVTGSLCWDFFCVAISLRAFSCQLASVVDFCVVYLCISLFRNILFFSGENTFTVFWGVSLGKFGLIEYMDGVVWFFLYIFFCSCSFFNFQICSILFFCNAY